MPITQHHHHHHQHLDEAEKFKRSGLNSIRRRKIIVKTLYATMWILAILIVLYVIWIYWFN